LKLSIHNDQPAAATTLDSDKDNLVILASKLISISHIYYNRLPTINYWCCLVPSAVLKEACSSWLKKVTLISDFWQTLKNEIPVNLLTREHLQKERSSMLHHPGNFMGHFGRTQHLMGNAHHSRFFFWF
jgi:hypothetical protein